MLVDTHAHLDFDEFQHDLPAVIERADIQDVKYIINVGVDIRSCERSIELARAFPRVYAAIGIHPHEASKITLTEVMPAIQRLVQAEKVIALGEIGLDYYRKLADPVDQEKLLRAFLAIYKQTHLPLIIHTREAHTELFTLLREECGTEPIKGVMHCFSGDEQALHEALSLGLHISFTGSITYKKNDELRRIVTRVPDNRLLLETDCPYLPPQSQRGQRNEPAFLRELAMVIAELRGITLADLGRITTLNCHALFGFPEVNYAPKVVYKIRDSLYINTTKECSNACTFCIRFYDDYVKGHNLRIPEDPTARLVLDEIDMYSDDIKEVVFCGFGEPLIRLDFIKEVAQQLKQKNIYIRIDTNGQGNIIHKRNILPELQGLIDALSVSLNTPNAALYNKICRPRLGDDVFNEVLHFIREAKRYVPNVSITFLDLPEIDVDAMHALARELGVSYRMRHYDRVG